MTHSTLSNAELARECLRQLGEEKGAVKRAAYVLEIVAHSTVGLGEVLQDYAHQAWGQLHEVIHAARNIAEGVQSTGDIEMLQNAHTVVKTVKTVLEQTPAAMSRNKAATLGDKEKLTSADVQQVADAFSRCPDVERLLASEESGRALLSALAGEQAPAPFIVPDRTKIFLHSPLHN